MSDSLERKPHKLYGLDYMATEAQGREMTLRLTNSPVWIEWCAVDYQVKQGRFDATDPVAARLCSRLAELEREMVRTAAKLIADMVPEGWG